MGNRSTTYFVTVIKNKNKAKNFNDRVFISIVCFFMSLFE